MPATTLGNNSQVSASGTGNSFTFLALDSLTLPNPLPAGCANYKPLGDGFTLTEGRTDNTGALSFVYSIRKELVSPWRNGFDPFGWPFVPLCAGGQRLDGNGDPIPCDLPDAAGGWKGRVLDSKGRVALGYKKAVCDLTTHLWWGILATPLDKLFVDSSVNPTVTGLSVDSTNVNYLIKVPAPFDWKMG